MRVCAYACLQAILANVCNVVGPSIVQVVSSLNEVASKANAADRGM